MLVTRITLLMVEIMTVETVEICSEIDTHFEKDLKECGDVAW